MMRPVWVIDDDRSIRWVFEKALAREGIPFKTFAQATEAMEALEAAGAPQVLVSDIRMPGTSGLELLQTLKQRFPSLPVIVMTAYSDLESAVAAFQGGAFEYLPKPFDVDQAVELIRRALGESAREGEAAESLPETPDILGQAQSMQEVFRAVGRLSQSSATVLITGESGTVKELVARGREGLFREDLYHRLNVIRLRLPSLRERREDIPLLARHFLAKSARELGVEPKRLSDSAMARLSAQNLAGNVRQLENVCHWLTVMSPTQKIG